MAQVRVLYVVVRVYDLLTLYLRQLRTRLRIAGRVSYYHNELACELNFYFTSGT